MLIFAVVGCCLVVLVVAAFIHFCQHSLIYHPCPCGTAYVQVLPPKGVEIEYALPFGKQIAFYIPPPNDGPKRIWIAFCGNGSLALDWTGLLPGYPPNGDAFLLVDFRATAKIPATPRSTPRALPLKVRSRRSPTDCMSMKRGSRSARSATR
jgi:hypothetical protein